MSECIRVVLNYFIMNVHYWSFPPRCASTRTYVDNFVYIRLYCCKAANMLQFYIIFYVTSFFLVNSQMHLFCDVIYLFFFKIFIARGPGL